MRKLISIFALLVAYGVYGGTPGLPYFVKDGLVNVEVIHTNLAYWWVSSDALTNNGPYVTNWIDRIQRSSWTNYADVTNLPVVSTDGVYFNGTNHQTLTNIGVFIPATNNTHMVILSAEITNMDPGYGGGPAVYYDFLTAGTGIEWQWWFGEMRVVASGIDIANFGIRPQETSLFDMLYISDYVNTISTSYTNGIAVKTNSHVVAPTWDVIGGIPAGLFYYSGRVKEILIWTNVLDSNAIAYWHNYAKTNYGISP